MKTKAQLPIVVAIHGILTPQIEVSWVDRLDAFAALNNYNCRVLKREYGAGPLPLWNVLVKNRLHSRSLVNEIELFGNECRLSFVAHSNGTDIALKTIHALAARGIRTDRFVALGSILHSDVRKNGIMDLIENGHLGAAFSYSSTSDDAVRFGRHSLGYHGLGVEGFRGTNDHRVVTRWKDGYGHGTYFHPNIIGNTFMHIMQDLGIIKVMVVQKDEKEVADGAE